MRFQSFKIYSGLFYDLIPGLFWRMLHCHLRSMFILLLGRMFYKCVLGLIGLYFVQLFHYIVDFLPSYLYIIKSGILNFLTLKLCISPFNSVSFCYMYFEPLLLSKYVFIIIVFLMDWRFYYYKIYLLPLIIIFVSNLFCLILVYHFFLGYY